MEKKRKSPNGQNVKMLMTSSNLQGAVFAHTEQFISLLIHLCAPNIVSLIWDTYSGNTSDIRNEEILLVTTLAAGEYVHT